MNAIKSFAASFAIIMVIALVIGLLTGDVVRALLFGVQPAFGFSLAAAFFTLAMEGRGTPGAEKEVAANLWRGWEAVGGTLAFMPDSLRFTPHSVNVQTTVLNLPYADIASVAYANNLLIIPNALRVVAKDGKRYKFVLWQRGEVLAAIKARISA